MSPKLERFEMRLDEQMLTAIDEWGGEQPDAPSRAEAARRLIELGLATSSREVVRLTDGEKLLVIMMRDLYRHLNVKGGEIDADFIAQTIWGGHSWAPKFRMTGLFHDYEDNPRDVRFVFDILDMWDFIERGYEMLSKKDKERVAREGAPFGRYVTFTGFDGNNETAHLGIARLIIDDLERFSRFKGRDLNSHMPSVPMYQRMYDVFEPMRTTLIGRELNADEIIEILNGKHRPA